MVIYGSTPVTVSYYLLNSSIYRVEVDPDLNANDERNNPVDIADNATDFNLTDSTVTNPLFVETDVSISVTFAPEYNLDIWSNALPPPRRMRG